MVLVLVTVRINAGLEETRDKLKPKGSIQPREIRKNYYEGGNQLKRK